MSYIGKILVVLQLVLSICLMAFAGAVSTAQTNWKKVSEDTKKQLDDANKKYAELDQASKTAADKFNVDLKAEQEKAKEANARLSQSVQQVTLLTAENKRMSDEAAQTKQINTDLVDDSNSRQNEVKIVRGLLKSALADRDKEFQAKAALEDKIFQQVTDIERLSTQNKTLMVANQQYRDVLITKGLPFEIEDYLKAKSPPPKVEGVVMETKKPKDGGSLLLSISIGENDGLSKDNVLSVYRLGTKEKYLGRARILEVHPDTAVCEIVGKASGLVEKGDYVTTKF